MKRIAGFVLLFIFVAAVAAETLVGCVVQGTKCNKCLDKTGCGYCGALGLGVCLPGTVDGSAVEKFGQDSECPPYLWRFTEDQDFIDETCEAPSRYLFTDDKDDPEYSTFTSWTIDGAGTDAELDSLEFGVAMKPVSVTDYFRPTATIRYAFVVGTDFTTIFDSYTLAATVFTSMLEWKPKADGSFFDCTEILDTSVAEIKVLCNDYEIIEGRELKLENLTNVVSTLLFNETSTNTTVWSMATQTFDEYNNVTLFSLECTFASGNITYGGIDMNPYVLYCDVNLNWNFRDARNHLALQMTAASIRRSGKENDGYYSLDLGGGAFLEWDSFYNTALGDGEVKSPTFQLFDNPDSVWDANQGPVLGGFLSFLGQPGQADISWSFRIGFDPLAAREFAINPATSLVPALLFVCVGVLLALLA